MLESMGLLITLIVFILSVAGVALYFLYKVSFLVARTALQVALILITCVVTVLAVFSLGYVAYDSHLEVVVKPTSITSKEVVVYHRYVVIDERKSRRENLPDIVIVGSARQTIEDDDRNIICPNGKCSARIEGDRNFIDCDKGECDLSIVGSSNTIKCSTGLCKIHIVGSSNDVECSGGRCQVRMNGSSNDVGCSSGYCKVHMSGSSNDVRCSGGHCQVHMSGSSNSLDCPTNLCDVKAYGSSNSY